MCFLILGWILSFVCWVGVGRPLGTDVLFLHSGQMPHHPAIPDSAPVSLLFLLRSHSTACHITVPQPHFLLMWHSRSAREGPSVPKKQSAPPAATARVRHHRHAVYVQYMCNIHAKCIYTDLSSIRQAVMQYISILTNNYIIIGISLNFLHICSYFIYCKAPVLT